MIRHVLDRARACPELSGVYVATDDERIAGCVRDCGAEVVMTREDHRSGTDRICEAAQKMGLDDMDIVVNIQGDQPLFQPSLVTQLIAPLMEDPSLPMSTLKHRITAPEDIESPHQVKVVTDLSGNALYFSRHPIPFLRDAPRETLHYKHLGFYGFRMHFLSRFTGLSEGLLEAAEKLEQLRVLEHGFRIRVVETPFNSVEVDVPEDLRRVEACLGS
jgi:3-deoxy-manno-octulosonate cytidylyltransferase (CMP-KDO synthetase)